MHPPGSLLQGRPAIRKALVVTPSTLTQNWADECRKWLGTERMRALVLQLGADGKQQVGGWVGDEFAVPERCAR